MNKIRLLSIAIIFYSCLLFAGNTGKISGKVTDQKNKEGLIGVNVLVVGTTLGAATDIDGNYSIIGVPPGTYTLKVSMIGYNPITISNVSVNIDLTTTQDFQLGESAVEVQEVVIVAEKPLVQKDITATTAVVGKELIENLAVTEIKDVIQLQAGISVSQGGELHLRGGRGGQIAYQIDGVSVTDAYDRSNTIEVGANAVQELQVISGAFNAEYGQAMSGVVNIVTKDGSDNFAGNIQGYTGNYISNRDNIFWNIKNFSPLSNLRSIEGSLSGPVINNKLFFYVNARNYYNTGYFYGKKVFNTTDISREDPANPGSNYLITQTGDGSYVPMNTNLRSFFQGKLTYRFLPSVKLSYNYIIDAQNYQDFEGNERLTPDNNLHRFRKTNSNILTINHTLSKSSFYNLSFLYLFKDYRHYLYEDIYTGNPLRPTLYVDNNLKQNPPYSFDIGGTNANRFTRNTGSYGIKLDFMNQYNNEIAIQVGGEVKQHRIFYQNINLVPLYDANGQQVSPYNVTIAPISSQDYDEYFHKPLEGSVYAQSKFEAFNLIFNAGVRFDYFDPNALVLNDEHSDPSDPLYYMYTVDDPNITSPLKPDNQFFDNNHNGIYEPDLGEKIKTIADREQYWYKKASVKTQISPRLALAFPISADGVIHFSYGHFFQLPGYELLYTNPEFELGVGSGNQGLFGNADLEPQKTIKGELGVKQQLSEDIAADITMFFEDFRDLTGTQTADILVFGRDRSYSKYVNSDFGFSKGIVLKLEKRFSYNYSVNLDYTFSITKGNASNPADSRNAVLGGASPETFIAPLDWDQTHTLNLVFSYSQSRDWGISAISSFYSGQPYTPAVNKNDVVKKNAFPRNSAAKPNVFNVDLRANKDFRVGTSTLSFFVKVYNLLDLDNARNVYTNSGDPFFTFDRLEAEKVNSKLYYNSLDDLYNDPGFFSEPRRIEFGTSFTF